MSSLLEQAIIDANALKEAALKNAEASILDKYSIEIKDALKTLLEQEEAALGTPAVPDMGGAAPSAEPEIKGVNLASTDGEKLCSCPDEDEQQKIKLDVNQLADEVSNMEATPHDQKDSLMSREDLYGSVASPNSPPTQMQAGLQEKRVYKLDASLLQESETEEEYELDDELLEEETQVNIGGLDPSNYNGYKGSSYGFDPTNHTVHDLKLSKAQEQIKLEKEENAKLRKTEKELKKELKEAATIAVKLSNKVDQYENVVSTLKEKLDSFALSNAKLLYTNRVLSNASLNERQKNKIVETLSNAKTPDEAKTIFETLQSAVVSANSNNAPKSLNEAVTRNVLSSISNRREKEETQAPVLERMQILAGIKK